MFLSCRLLFWKPDVGEYLVRRSHLTCPDTGYAQLVRSLRGGDDQGRSAHLKHRHVGRAFCGWSVWGCGVSVGVGVGGVWVSVWVWVWLCMGVGVYECGCECVDECGCRCRLGVSV